uniref:R3H domain-containing protein n=1 Tax=Wuchereria bancrofti TaxID=6293 RepID=A0A1I8EH94_WUCBA
MVNPYCQILSESAGRRMTVCERSCAAEVIITCSCLRKSSKMPCSDVEKAYQKLLSLKIMEDNHSNLLPCDVECQRTLRNRKMAKILNISHPDAADALSAFLKNKLKTNYKDILDVEDTLIELLHDLDAQPNVTSVSYSFPPMHSELRRIIHEYSGHFGIETVSYGQEPQRNVVATARRDVSYMPAVLLTASKKYTTESSLLASSSAAFAPSKTLPPTSKNFSCGGSKMQQLQSGGKVLKRGFKEPLLSQK